MTSGSHAARRRAILAAGVFLLTATGVLVARGLGRAAAELVRPVRTDRSDDVFVESIDSERRRIRLRGSAEAGLPGRYAVWLGRTGRSLQLGEVTSTRNGVWEREILDGDAPGYRGRGSWSGWYHRAPEDVADRVEQVLITGDHGTLPAWFFPASDHSVDEVQDWVIAIHGRGTTRAEVLRAVPAIQAAGWSVAAVSYRNDGAAPASARGAYGLGSTEWRDIDAAVDLLRARGARRIVLMGWSMGGAIAVQAARRSPHADLIAGLILESPALDWRDILRTRARERHLPEVSGAVVAGILGTRGGAHWAGADGPIDFSDIDATSHAEQWVWPTLVLHSSADDFVPSGPSERLAAARPELIELELFEHAAHTKMWNMWPERWEARITQWLRSAPRGE